eukprot:11232057-Alexandrium_andersonii.AAC.1
MGRSSWRRTSSPPSTLAMSGSARGKGNPIHPARIMGPLQDPLMPNGELKPKREFSGDDEHVFYQKIRE